MDVNKCYYGTSNFQWIVIAKKPNVICLTDINNIGYTKIKERYFNFFPSVIWRFVRRFHLDNDLNRLKAIIRALDDVYPRKRKVGNTWEITLPNFSHGHKTEKAEIRLKKPFKSFLSTNFDLFL